MSIIASAYIYIYFIVFGICQFLNWLYLFGTTCCKQRDLNKLFGFPIDTQADEIDLLKFSTKKPAYCYDITFKFV